MKARDGGWRDSIVETIDRRADFSAQKRRPKLPGPVATECVIARAALGEIFAGDEHGALPGRRKAWVDAAKTICSMG